MGWSWLWWRVRYRGARVPATITTPLAQPQHSEARTHTARDRRLVTILAETERVWLVDERFDAAEEIWTVDLLRADAEHGWHRQRYKYDARPMYSISGASAPPMQLGYVPSTCASCNDSPCTTTTHCDDGPMIPREVPMLSNVSRYLCLVLLFAALLAGCGVPQSAVNPTATPASPATVLPQPTVTPAPATPTVSGLAWTREQFGSAWNIAYPASWEINTAGAHEGNLTMRGSYNGHTYEVSFSYPIFEQPVDTLDAWVDQVLAKLTPEQRQRVTVVDVTVAGAPAKKVLNVPGDAPGDIGHYVYIWRGGGQNPRPIVIRQRDDQPFDSAQAEQLLDHFLAGIAPPRGTTGRVILHCTASTSPGEEDGISERAPSPFGERAHSPPG
jgi:hypothetical protein